MQLQEKNYKSDFELRLTDEKGAAIQLSAMNWSARFRTENSVKPYEASYKDGKFTNAYAGADGEIFIVFDNHGLSTGRLTVELSVDVPNANFPDGYVRTVQPYPLDVMLVKHATETPRTLDVQLMLPYIYRTAYDDAVAAGYTGTLEQYMQLIQTLPTLAQTAQDAADKAEAIADAESERVSAELQRVTAEADRRDKEQLRQEAESERQQLESERSAYYEQALSDEQTRVDNEAARVAAEAARVKAEESRESSESERRHAEADRADAESARVEAEKLREQLMHGFSQADSSRAAAEQTRREAESARVEAENARVEAENARVAAESLRETETQTAIDEMTALKDDTQTAADNANAAAEEARSTMQDIDADVQAKLKTVQESNESIQTEIDTLVNGNASTAIESFTEVTNFLAGIEDTQTLDGIVGGIGKSIDENAQNIASNASAITELTNSLTAEEKRATDAEKALSKSVANNSENIAANADAIKTNAETIELLQKSVVGNRADIDTLLKDLGYYGEIASEEISLEVDESGYAITTDGVKKAMSGYAISKEVALTQGNLYLIKANAVDKSVSMFAKKEIETHTDHVSYSYTYDSEGNPLTATADYDSTVVYTFNYEEVESSSSSSDEDTASTTSTTKQLKNITLNGTIVSEIPDSRTYTLEVYTPLFKTGAIATPKSGYYVYFCPTAMSIIISAKQEDLTASDTDETKGKFYGARYGFLASIASNYVNRWERDELDERITALEKIHENDDYSQKDYCVGAWVDSDLSPDSVKTYGDEQAMYDLYEKVLIDTEDNTGTTTTPVGVLKDDNLFRFSDGRFAPAVAITADDYADSELELFRLVDGEYTQYCEAGSYNAESYLEDVLRPVVQATPNDISAAQLYKLVDDEYVAAHAVLPWETTETKYSHGLANKRDLYLLDNVIGNSGYRWKGVFAYPAVWDGIDTAPYKLAPTAMCLSPICTVGGKARSFFYLFKGTDSDCYGHGGRVSNGLFYGERTYPRTNTVSQVDCMTYSRANNADTSASYPCAEGGFHSYNTLLNALEVANHTKYLHRNTRYGSGISSNDTCNSESTYLLNGGTRYRVNGSTTWKYATWAAKTDIYYNASGGIADISDTINYYYAKEQCEESQIAHSWFAEFGIANNAHFSMYGGEYWVVPNPEAVSSQMNARVYRKLHKVISAYNSSGEATDFEFECVLRMSLYNGMNCSGDTFVYRGGGQESIGTINPNATGQGTYGHTVDVYAQNDQTQWTNDRTEVKSNLGVFAFESAYRKLATYKTVTNGYARSRVSYAPDKTVNGGNLSQGECYYGYSAKYWSTTANARIRIGLRFAAYAYFARIALRATCLATTVLLLATVTLVALLNS